MLGSGNEFLVYDSDDDGMDDYSAGVVGARVLDIYDVMDMNATDIDDYLGAVNGTLLPALDPDGMFFGVMTDLAGHGTRSAAVVASSGEMTYDIYNDTGKALPAGVAPEARILPVKVLWFGDVVYAGCGRQGLRRTTARGGMQDRPGRTYCRTAGGVDFSKRGDFSGYDALSLLMGMLATPHSLDDDYPGVLMVASAGNSGHGYGTVGMPGASPLGVSVGATNNNVIVGYGVAQGRAAVWRQHGPPETT